MLNEKIIDLESGEETIRPYTKSEVAEAEKAQAKAQAKADLLAEKEAAKQALFEKLGITEDEAKLLFG